MQDFWQVKIHTIHIKSYQPFLMYEGLPKYLQIALKFSIFAVIPEVK